MKILLIVAYVSLHGVPQIDLYQRDDMKQCRQEAQFIFNQVRAGSVRSWCHRVIDHGRKQ